MNCSVCYRLVGALLIILVACTGKKTESTSSNLLSYTIVKAYPHDISAFTQGLAIDNGRLYESTGQEGSSWIAEVNIVTGAQDKKVVLEKKYFGEGITVLNNKVFQLTWKNRKGFIYDIKDFKSVREFDYVREGWGITHNGERLIVSDGTSKLYFLDSATLEVRSTVSVTEDGQEVSNLNELEFIEGFIFANQWLTNRIVKIDPATGAVVGRLDLTDLATRVKQMNPDADVLNGIAYEGKSKTILVTGKLWPVLFAFRIRS